MLEHLHSEVLGAQCSANHIWALGQPRRADQRIASAAFPNVDDIGGQQPVHAALAVRDIVHDITGRQHKDVDALPWDGVQRNRRAVRTGLDKQQSVAPYQRFGREPLDQVAIGDVPIWPAE